MPFFFVAKCSEKLLLYLIGARIILPTIVFSFRIISSKCFLAWLVFKYNLSETDFVCAFYSDKKILIGLVR